MDALHAESIKAKLRHFVFLSSVLVNSPIIVAAVLLLQRPSHIVILQQVILQESVYLPLLRLRILQFLRQSILSIKAQHICVVPQ